MNHSDTITLFPLGNDTSASSSSYIEGSKMLVSHWMGPVDTSSLHSIQAEFKAVGQSPSIVFFGLDCASQLPCSDNPADESRVKDIDVFFKQKTEAIVMGYDASANTIQVAPDSASSLANWFPSSSNNCKRQIAFFFDGETNRKPDYVHVHQGKARGGYHSVDIQGGLIFLNNPQLQQEREKKEDINNINNTNNNNSNSLPSHVVEKIVPGKTIVRNHHSGASYLFVGPKGEKLESSKWHSFDVKLKGEGFQNDPKKFRVGTKYVRLVVLANWGQTEDEVILFRNVTFTQTRTYRFLKAGVPQPPKERNAEKKKQMKQKEENETRKSAPSSVV